MNTHINRLERVTLGTAGLGGTWRPVDLEQSVETVLFALEQGINHIDMAPAYMYAEEIVGKALKRWKGSQPFLSTKIGKKRGMANQQGLTDYTVDNLKLSLMSSLEILDRDQIDLLFLHEPDQIPIHKLDSIMNTILLFKEKGLVKKIGLGGSPPKCFRPFIEDGCFDVVMDFNGYNLVERKALKEDFPFYRKYGLKIYEGSPLMMGLLGRRLEKYASETPPWLSMENLKKANSLNKLALNFNIPLSSMAHRYLLFNKIIDRMVIGPAVFNQLKSTISAINQGPLPERLLIKIEEINCIKL